MSERRSARTRRLAAFSLVLGIVWGLDRPAWSQYQTMNPYDRYSNSYRAYTYPLPAGGSRLPSPAGLPAGPVSSPFDSYFEESPATPGSDDPFGRGFVAPTPGRGVPYYQAYRRNDDRAVRNTSPQVQRDLDYYRDKEDRDRLYTQALRETDPRRRAALLREVERRNAEAIRGNVPRRSAPDPDPPRSEDGATRATPSPAAPRAAAPRASNTRRPSTTARERSSPETTPPRERRAPVSLTEPSRTVAEEALSTTPRRRPPPPPPPALDSPTAPAVTPRRPPPPP